MPSFLSKVFGRKKDDKDSSPTNPLGPGELLGGKFEAISPNVSPTAAHFLELQPGTVPGLDAHSGRFIDEEKDFGLPFFRTRSPLSSPEVKPKRLVDNLPPLSLDFDLKDKSAYNGYIFEESNSEAIFPDDVLGHRRLNPMEALVLVRACSKAIISRGLETLGIMTPHWYSASQDIQRRLISNFLRSLDLTTSVGDPISSSPHITNFEDEVNFTRSIHDIAAVLRWGLRHVQLEGDTFGTSDGWYKAFVDAEAASDYPLKAFSEKLAPSLPTSHLDMVVSTLEVFSSLAAFSEANSTSGSRLSKIFGLWLLTARRVEDKDDWKTFYARWERTGRMLEHLFLARIRDESADQRMPTRLLELVHQYPFTHGLSPPTTDLQLLPYPQFTTALHPALFVRIQYEVTSQERIPKTKVNPSVLLADAFSSKVEEGEFVDLWAKITSAASKTGSELPLGNVLANESLRLLSLIGDKPKEEFKSPAFSVISLVEPQLQRAASNGAASVSFVKPSIESAPLVSTALSPIGSDWEQFSASGFLDIDQSFPPLVSTLFDTDIEKTEPREIPLPISRKSSKRAIRKSLELPRSLVIAESSGGSSPDPTNPKSSSQTRQQVITPSQLEVIELDEAFVDFWSDALLDRIASDWPTFVVCKFKPTLVPDLTFGTGDETLKWLVLERVYSVKPRPIPASLPLTTLPIPAETSTPASPIAQTPTGRRLFNFWSVSRTPSSSSTGSQKTKKSLWTPKVGEMGELIEEDTNKVSSPTSKKFKSLDLPGVKRLSGKKSVDVTRPEISASASTDVDARATTSSVVAASAVATAAAVATTTVVQLATEKQEGDVVEEVIEPEAAATSLEPVLETESTNDVAKHDVVPVEADVTLADVENAGVPTTLATVPEQDAQIVDVAAPAELAIASFPETAIVADEPQTKEPTKEEGGTINEEDSSHHPQEVDQSFLVSAGPPEVELPVQQDGEIDQKMSISSVIGEPDKPVLDVVSEELQAPLITGEDEPVEISGEDLGEVSEKPEVEEQGTLTEAATATVVSSPPEVETQVSETETKIDEPVEEDASPVGAKPEEAFGALPVATLAEEAFVPALSVAQPAPIVVVDEYLERGPSVEEVSNVVASTEVVPSVDDAAARGIPPVVEETEADESVLGDVTAPGDSSSAIIEHVEEVSPTGEPFGVIEAPPILDDDSAPAEELPVGQETVATHEILNHSLEVGRAQALEDSPVVEADAVMETVSEVIAAGASDEPAMDESEAPEAPLETAAEEPEPSADAPIQDLSAYEAVPPVEIITPQEATKPADSEQLTTERASIVEGRSLIEIGVGDDEAPVDESDTIEEEPSQAAHAVETVGAGIAETQEATADEVSIPGGSPEEPYNDSARETFASEDMQPVEALLDPLVAVELESEVPPAEPTSEFPSEQQIIRSEESVTETALPVEEPNQGLPAFEEEIPTQLETEESPLVESRPPTEEPQEEQPVESKVSEELPATEPELFIKTQETALADAPTEVLDESDAINEPPLAEDATLAQAVVLDVPEREEISSTSGNPGAGEPSITEEEIPLGVPERTEEFLEQALPTSEDAHVEKIPFADPLPIGEVAPQNEEEPLGEETPVATDEITAEARVAEETLVGVGEGAGAVGPSAETTTEIKERDAPAENVAVSVPEVSEASPLVAEEAIPVTAEEPVPSATAEPALGEVLSEAQAVNEAAIIEEVVEVVDAEDSINVAEPSMAVDEPALPDEAPKHVPIDEDSPTAIVETLSQKPSLLDTNPVQEPLVAETSAQATPASIEDTTTPLDEHANNAEDSPTVEQPSTLEESIPSADAEKFSVTEAPIPLDEGVSPPVDGVVSVPGEESPVIVEEVVRTVPDPVEEVSIPVEEIPPVIPAVAEQPTTMADESIASEQHTERGDNVLPTPVPEVPADTDQPIHNQEVDPAVEGGIVDEPIFGSAARDDLSIEKFDEPQVPDAPVASSTTDIPNKPSEEEPVHTDLVASATANTLDPTIAGTTFISEKGPVVSSIIDSSSSTDIVPDSLAELSPESGDPTPTGQLEPLAEDTDELPAIPEHVAEVSIDADEPAILDEVQEVPTFVEESRALAELSEGPAAALLEDPELAIEATISPDDTVKAGVDESALEPSEANTALEKLNNGEAATDVETTVNPIPITEAQK